MINPSELTIKEASELLISKKISSVELTQACLKSIKEHEPNINAFTTILEEDSLKAAELIDEKRQKGEALPPLAGIPYSLKDVYNTTSHKTTAGSRVLEDYISPYDATVYTKLQKAGAILLGKTNCDPFGFGSSTENSAYGTTKNPINPEYVPGGSSGGSAAAVKYGGGLFSIGEDTGGSIRCPASFCGIYGLKPTYGRVSRYGSIAYASSYDCVGPMAKSTQDIAMILQEIAGIDPKDATSSPENVPDYLSLINTDITNKTIGIPKEYFSEGLDEKVRDIIMQAVQKFEKAGCIIKEISLPYTEYAVAAYYVVGISEASSNLGRFDSIRFGLDVDADNWRDAYKKSRGQAFTHEEKRRVMAGTYALSSGYADQYYNKAQKVRQLLRDDFARAFTEVDLIITPTMPILPFKIGEKMQDPLQLWLADAFTTAINPVGVPAMSIPAGTTDTGLPVGMQLIAPHFNEELIMAFSQKYEIENR